MKYNMKLEVPPALKKALRDPGSAASQELERGILKSVIYTAGQVRKYAPVRTGRLRRSITHSMEDRFKGVVGTNVIYARIQEFGGTITPKRKSVLAWVTSGDRPTTKAGWREARKEGRVAIAHEVTIEGKGYFAAGIRASMSRIRQYLGVVGKNIGVKWGFK